MTKESYRNVRKKRYTQVSNSFLNDPDVSLQAKGLLSIFLSNTNDWEIHMAEIINRSKNGRDAHYSAVNELIKFGYFARVKILDVNNKFVKMEYIFSDEKSDIVNEIERIKEWAKDDNKRLTIEYCSEKYPFPENPDTAFPNTENQNNNNTKDNNTKDNNTKSINHNIENIDDDKRISQQVGKDSHVHDEEAINLIISNLRESTKNDLRESSFKSVVKKVVDKYNQGKISISNFRSYLVASLANKIEELEERKAKEGVKAKLKANKNERILRRKEQLEQQPVRKDIYKEDWFKVFSEILEK